MAIHVEESALNDLRNALETAGTEYKNNYARLQNLISEITSGDIQGDPANDLLAKFQAKDDTFKYSSLLSKSLFIILSRIDISLFPLIKL